MKAAWKSFQRINIGKAKKLYKENSTCRFQLGCLKIQEKYRI